MSERTTALLQPVKNFSLSARVSYLLVAAANLTGAPSNSCIRFTSNRLLPPHSARVLLSHPYPAHTAMIVVRGG